MSSVQLRESHSGGLLEPPAIVDGPSCMLENTRASRARVEKVAHEGILATPYPSERSVYFAGRCHLCLLLDLQRGRHIGLSERCTALVQRSFRESQPNVLALPIAQSLGQQLLFCFDRL